MKWGMCYNKCLITVNEYWSTNSNWVYDVALADFCINSQKYINFIYTEKCLAQVAMLLTICLMKM